MGVFGNMCFKLRHHRGRPLVPRHDLGIGLLSWGKRIVTGVTYRGDTPGNAGVRAEVTRGCYRGLKGVLRAHGSYWIRAMNSSWVVRSATSNESSLCSRERPTSLREETVMHIPESFERNRLTGSQATSRGLALVAVQGKGKGKQKPGSG